MLTTEQVKKIAKHLGLEFISEFNGKVFTTAMYMHSELFDPINGDENSKVLNALVNECKDQNIILIDSVIGKKLEFGPLYIETGNGKLNENICLAFLNKMDGK